MKKQVFEFVKSCMVCQQAKPDRVKSPGLLQPLPVPESAWQIITMYFIEGLPQSAHADCILVVVDKFTKYRHFLPLRHPYTAPSVAKMFMDNIYKLHELPLFIVSDRNRVFASKLCKELFILAKVQYCLSSTI
jgi:hypothetical protein